MKHQKTIEAKVISISMQQTVIVEVERRVKHPLYKKAVKRTKHVAVDSLGRQVAVGDVVRIVETRPISKTKHFRLV